MRIIGGTAKGHAIKAPKGMETRPTLDRVRESVFNVLSNKGLLGADFLDLFSGTGAVAIEALSRGAAHAVAVDFKTSKLILENAIHCRVSDKLEIIPRKLSQLNEHVRGRQFDYIFSDPPYEHGFIQATIDLVLNLNILKPAGILLLEHHKDERFVVPESLECIKQQKFGYTIVSYFVNIAERS